MSKLTYISLFSSAGIGCYGFKENGYECIATNELLESRMKIQRYNDKCKYPSGYICGDIHSSDVKDKIFKEIEFWKQNEGIDSVDVLMATPPCQGMSTVNYKKNDEQTRNSLVVEAIRMVKQIQPKIFVFENVRAFMTTVCTDVDGSDKTIKESIFNNLSDEYNIEYRVINFQDYGVPSSRPRTLVIGTSKALKNVSPLNLFPRKKDRITVRKAIGDLKPLGFCESDDDDIYHFARPFPEYMLEWIKDLKEGESALNNPPETRPYKLTKNGREELKSSHINNKFRRLFWDKPGACIHTRNDIICSQDTIHPSDNRVLSIRELMRIMSIPASFKWTDISLDTVDRTEFLANNELNIRRCIGEAVPTAIISAVAENIKDLLAYEEFVNNFDAKKIDEYLANEALKGNFYIRSFILEMNQDDKKKDGVFFTPQGVVYESLKALKLDGGNILRVLEPSVGLGAFLPQLISTSYKYDFIEIDAYDINKTTIQNLKELIKLFGYNNSVRINYFNEDFLQSNLSDKKYDVVVSNPPFGKPQAKDLKKYRTLFEEPKINNLFAFFMKKFRKSAPQFVIVLPKTFLMANEYSSIREQYKDLPIVAITDYGVKFFPSVFIEIISICFEEKYIGEIAIENKLENKQYTQPQNYIFHNNIWLLYRDKWFDEYISTLKLGYFDFFRDRQIRNSHLKKKGKYWVVKSKNIDDEGNVNHIEGYDRYVDDISSFNVKKFLNTGSIIMPNFTYNTRAALIPDNCIANGSVVFLTPTVQEEREIDLQLYSTEEFRRYYAIVKNKAKFTINIDSDSIYYIGVRFIDE